MKLIKWLKRNINNKVVNQCTNIIYVTLINTLKHKTSNVVLTTEYNESIWNSTITLPIPVFEFKNLYNYEVTKLDTEDNKK